VPVTCRASASQPRRDPAAGRVPSGRSLLLKRHGYRLVAAPQGFLVCPHGTLLDGEASWARRWGMTLGAASRAHVQNAPEGASR